MPQMSIVPQVAETGLTTPAAPLVSLEATYTTETVMGSDASRAQQLCDRSNGSLATLV